MLFTATANLRKWRRYKEIKATKIIFPVFRQVLKVIKRTNRSQCKVLSHFSKTYFNKIKIT